MSQEHSVTETPVQHAPQAAGDDSNGYELDEDGQRVPHGMGQSKSSRRRRRKRKGKGAEAGDASSDGQASGQTTGETANIVRSLQAGEAPASQQPFQAQGNSRQNNGHGRSFQAGAQNSGGQQNNSAPGGTKRWKKKIRDRDRPRPQESNPGAQQGAQGSSHGGSHGSSNGGSGFSGGFRGPDTHQPGNGGSSKRKGGFGAGGGGKQQRGPRSFVGPMDHSYRVVNGNVFDGASTVDSQQQSYGGGRPRGYQSDSQPIDYSQGRAVPIAADAPTKIYFFIEDLFFTAKIQETARKLGVKVAFIKNDKEQIAALTEAAENDRPGLIVFDLNNANAKPLTLIPKLKTKLKKTTSIIGFLSHLQGDLKAKAVEAGCDTVMPRAAFSQNLPNLLRRYGIEDVEEPNYNQ